VFRPYGIFPEHSDFGEVPLETPRDRNGSYEPKIIGKNQTRFTGFDDKIISMYARGMGVPVDEGTRTLQRPAFRHV